MEIFIYLLLPPSVVLLQPKKKYKIQYLSSLSVYKMDWLSVKALVTEHHEQLRLVESAFTERFVWGWLEGNIVRVLWHIWNQETKEKIPGTPRKKVAKVKCKAAVQKVTSNMWVYFWLIYNCSHICWQFIYLVGARCTLNLYAFLLLHHIAVSRRWFPALRVRLWLILVESGICSNRYLCNTCATSQ